ncbi:AlpA family transcriptional regulator [Mycobacterium sp. TY814]|uniref:helix-turn-helix transcriptional regulator n=1 Tax=Mycobacterium sp. TY814 TaxID=3050580 RepID=UPI0027404754|nr:helix-turn-helix domain-containing protein [Mycobacterium sp. TY814]MDP7725096.1 helix-turn-helix domain-containing protein [Mycobacterium sp. TY814]
MEHFDTQQLSDYLGTPVPTLRWWRHQNKGPKSFRLGRRVVYSRDDVDQWVRDQRAATVRGDG